MRRRDPDRHRGRHETGRSIVLAARARRRGGRRSPAAGRHVRPRERRAARVHGLAVDGREARPHARRRRHRDVPPPGARRRSRCFSCCGRRSGLAPATAGTACSCGSRPRPSCCSSRQIMVGRGQRVDTAPAVGGRRARRALRPDLGDGRRARHGVEARRGRTRHGRGATRMQRRRTRGRDRPSLRDTVTAYYRLTKPRIVLLLLITTVPGDAPRRREGSPLCG